MEFSDTSEVNITNTPYGFGEVIVDTYDSVLCEFSLMDDEGIVEQRTVKVPKGQLQTTHHSDLPGVL